MESQEKSNQTMTTFRRRRFDPAISNPRGPGIQYQCEICGDRLDSCSEEAVACSCRNLVLDVDAGRISAKDPTRVCILEGGGGKEVKRSQQQGG